METDLQPRADNAICFTGVARKATMNKEQLDQYIKDHIQGVFGEYEVFKEEVSKLKPGQIYLEIGVDEGKSMTVAHHYAKKGVYIIGIDFHDVPPHKVSIGRGPFAESQGIIGHKKPGFFVHGDADVFSELWDVDIDLLFIDGGHSYEEVKENTLNWERFVPPGGTILFHDTDSPGVMDWLNEHYSNWENIGDKIGRVRM